MERSGPTFTAFRRAVWPGVSGTEPLQIPAETFWQNLAKILVQR